MDEDFLNDQVAKQGDMPYEKPQNIYMHEQVAESGNLGDFRLKNLDPEFSRHFN